MLLIDFNFKHGIGKGFNDFTFYFDLVLFWHSFLSLLANALFSLLCLSGTAVPMVLLNMAAVTRSDSDKLNDDDDCKGYKMAAVVTAATNYEL